MKISFVGFLPRKSCLVLDITTMPFFPMTTLFSLGEVFGGIRFTSCLREYTQYG
jgi:hypothetical protein